jgi:transcriptional regulator with XRE-family HTH domain
MESTPVWHKIAIGSRLRAAREALNLKPTVLRLTLGISAQKLSNWESGRTYPDWWLLCRFCDAYSIPTDYLLLGKLKGVPPDVAADLGAAALATQPARQA